MPRSHDIHGVTVALLDGAAMGPAGALVRTFPEVDASPTMVIRTARGSVPTREVLRAHWSPVLFHGHVQGWARDGAFVYEDGRSGALVAGDGASIDLDLAPEDDAYFVAFAAVLHALRVHGLFELHAAAVEARGAGILVPGESGAGKSTLSIAVALHGGQLVNDDTVVLRRRDVDFEVLSMRTHLHVGPRTLAAFPELVAHARARTSGVAPKHVVEATAVARVLPSLPRADVLLFPEIVDAAQTTVEPLSQAEAYGHLLRVGSPWLREPAPRARELGEVLFTLATRARGFEVRLGRDILDHPRDTVSGLLDVLSG